MICQSCAPAHGEIHLLSALTVHESSHLPCMKSTCADDPTFWLASLSWLESDLAAYAIRCLVTDISLSS
jgi:hypothetical protein